MNRSRARAIAIARRRPDPLPWLPWLLLLGLLTAGAALAQTNPAAPGGGSPLASPMVPLPGQATPPGPLTPDTPGGTTRNGVATPLPSRDPAMVTDVPARAGTMPVISPPGTPGGNPNVIPK